MASSISQYPSFPASIKSTIETIHSKTPRRNINITLIKALKDSSSSSSSSSDSEQPEPVKLALARAKAYKKDKSLNPTPKIAQNQETVLENSQSEENKDGSADKNRGMDNNKECLF